MSEHLDTCTNPDCPYYLDAVAKRLGKTVTGKMLVGFWEAKGDP